jgi:biotin carboxyl carrier protein
MSKIAVTIDEHAFTVEIPPVLNDDSTLTVLVDGEPMRVSLPDPGRTDWVIIDGRPYEVALDDDLRWIKSAAGLHRLEMRDLDAAVTRPVTGDGRLKAPIPGLISKIWVTPGQAVTLGEPVLILEAMKMQNELRAPRAGVVAGIHVQPGDTVTRAQVLVEIE